MPQPHQPMSDEPLSLSIRSAREAVLSALEEHRVSGMWISDLLDRVFRESRLPANERGLATELACGVIRRQGTLDAILKRLVAQIRLSWHCGPFCGWASIRLSCSMEFPLTPPSMRPSNCVNEPGGCAGVALSTAFFAEPHGWRHPNSLPNRPLTPFLSDSTGIEN